VIAEQLVQIKSEAAAKAEAATKAAAKAKAKAAVADVILGAELGKLV